MPSRYGILNHITGVIDDQRRDRLSSFHPGTGDYYAKHALGFPLEIGSLDERAAQWFAPNVRLGKIKFASSLKPKRYNDSSPERLAAKLTRLSLFTWLFRKKKRDKIKSLQPIIVDILKFDKETFGGERVVVQFEFDHGVVKPGRTRVPRWHTDRGGGTALEERYARSYILRPSLMTEFLREDKSYPNGKQSSLLSGIANKHTDPPEIYAQWVASLREQGLYFRPSANGIVLMTYDTYHRSYQPNEPTPSSFIRLSVRSTTSLWTRFLQRFQY
jgi:hypothetical protein